MPAKKYLGQHFLRDPEVIETLIASFSLTANDHLVEIGPGHGELTQHLIKQAHRLDVVELDADLIPHLKALAENYNHLIVHFEDALKFDFSRLPRPPQRLRILGNLPYNISTPLLFHFINYQPFIQDIQVMLQKEVVERIIAEPGGKDYGRLSVMLQYFGTVQKQLSIFPEAFFPIPKVESAILKFIPYPSKPYQAYNEIVFAKLVKTAFSQRRKMIRNTLKCWVNEKMLAALKIDPQERAENLSVEHYVRIANLVYEQKLGS